MINALNDFVIIKRLAVEKKKSSLVITDESVPQTGIVVSLGKECKQLKKGDKVFLPFHAKEQLEEDGQFYCYLHEKDIPAKLI